MADTFDVVNAIVGMVAQTLYPNGTGNPVSPVVNEQVKIYPGWAGKSLDKDLQASPPVLNVTVFPGHAETNTTRFLDGWQQVSPISYAMSATVSGATVQFAGVPGAGINLAVFVNGTPYQYSVQANDTLASVAAAFAALIAGSSASGAVLTVPNAHSFTARVGQAVQSALEVGRTKREFTITIWAPNPTSRDAAGSAIDLALRSLRNLPLADGSAGWITYSKSPYDDMPEKEFLYRRDLCYFVEFGAFQVESDQTVIIGVESVTGGLDPSAPAVKTINF